MVLIDVNLLVYAANPQAAQHEKARVWLEDRMNSGERVGIPLHSLLGFLRVATVGRALTMEVALSLVQEWLEWRTVWVPEPTVEHMKIVEKLLRDNPKSHLVPDAHLAALSIEHGLTVCSADRDFRLFDGIRVLNPLE